MSERDLPSRLQGEERKQLPNHNMHMQSSKSVPSLHSTFILTLIIYFMYLVLHCIEPLHSKTIPTFLHHF